jgi:putative ABC transport system substrate-binding protein
MKTFSKVITGSLLALAMAGCTVGGSSASAASSASAVSTDTSKIMIGIVQLVQHPALDSATKGFVDELKSEMNLTDANFDIQNASGDSATCSTIANAFVSEKADLILANATAALQAAKNATTSIPVLGTSVTEYGTALGISDFNGTPGGNVSGTSDLAPLDQQADMFTELLPNAKNIGILYCSGEPNSVYQVQKVTEYLKAKGLNVTSYPFTDTNDVAQVTQSAAASSDALYIPTDNTAASATETIYNVTSKTKTPIIAGEEGICSGCGIATLSIDYYELGKTTGKMAAKILKGEEDISKMEIEYYKNPKKEYNAKICQELGIEVPSDYTAIASN